MRKLFLLMAVALLAAASSAFGRQRADVVKKVDAFSEISVVGNIHVVYEQGSGYEVRLDSSAAACVDVRVGKSVLTLCPLLIAGSKVGGVYYNTVDWTNGVTVYVKAPSVGTFSLAGSGSISVDRITAKRVAFNVAGSGSVVIGRLSADETNFSVAGSGRLKASGVTAGKVNVSVAGPGSIKADVVKASELHCCVAGAGNITVSGKAGKYSRSVYGGGSIADGSLKYDKVNDSSVRSNSRSGTYYYGSGHKENGILSNP